MPVKPLAEQTVLATIHQFPSLEPLRFETYPANHLYLPTRKDILHRAVVYEGDMTREGTASTKTRHEIRGSAKKIRPQKGSGRARLGDKKSPMLRGGGVAFGPHPRDFSTDLPKKVYDLAWRTALSYRFRKGELIIVDNAMEIESPSPRLLGDIFKHHEKLRGKGRSLLVTLEERPLLQDALIEMDRAEQTLTWQEVDVKNLLELSRVIIERDALRNILLSHQEDLTHVALPPWHKSLVRSSPPSELEAVIGWQEFRDLQLLEEQERDEARPVAFESVASQRYELAETLPQGLQRNSLTRSAYELLADAKELQFERMTGISFANYATQVREQGEGDPATFPRIQALEYQRDIKSNLAADASQTSPLEGEELELEAANIEIQKLELQQQASLLAAQVWEHLDVAQRLAGDNEGGAESVALASAERTTLDILEGEILDKKIALAKGKMKVAKSKGNYAAVQKLQKELEALTEIKEQLVVEEVEEIDEVEDVPSPVEETRPQTDKK